MTIDRGEFDGKVVVVTGAGAGIGRTIAHRLAAGGADVVVTDKHQGRMHETAEALASAFPGVRVAAHVLDIEHRNEFDQVFAEVESDLGPISIYVWNAALNIPQPIFEQDPQLLDRILYANVNNCWYSCVRVVEQMRRAGGGAIVMIGSIAPDVGAAADEPAYAASKAAGRALMHGLARAGGPFQIRCNEVVMGPVIGTRFTDTRPESLSVFLPQVPLGRNARTEDVSEAVAFLASDRAGFISGAVLNVTGGMFLRL